MSTANSINRRAFLKGAAVAGAAVAATMARHVSETTNSQSAVTQAFAATEPDTVLTAENCQDIPWSFMIPPEPVSDDQITQIYTADVIIVGAGPSGLCTAVSCQEAGGDVIVLSASSKPVGRGGSNFGLDTDYQRESGIEWTRKSSRNVVRLREYYTHDGRNGRLWSKWLQNSRESVNWMIEHMASQGLKCQLELGNVDPDGFATVAPHSHNFYNDEFPDGMNSGAPLQAQAWANIFTENGGQIYFNTIGRYLIREDNNTGRVSAVIATDADGNYVKFEANKAVVLATGDFSKDPDMMACFVPEIWAVHKDILTAEPVNYDAGKQFTGTMPGDGHKMGLWVGAGWQKTPIGPMLMGMLPGPANGYNNFWGINLDLNGMRYHNEMVYDGIAANAMIRNPERCAFAIWDSEYFNLFDEWEPWGCTIDGSAGILPLSSDEMRATWDANVESGMCFKADTLEELCDMLGLNKENALASIERYNEYAENGEDLEFEVNPDYLRAIKTPPFYGSKGQNGALLTVCGGLRTNENNQVCQDDDTPIEGLYNTGIMTGDFFPCGYTYIMTGAAMGGEGCTLSYLLGKHLAEL